MVHRPAGELGADAAPARTGADATDTPAPPDHGGRLEALIEAVLFVADAPVEVTALARLAEASEAAIEAALAALAAVLHAEGRGVRLLRAGTAAQLVSAPELAPWVERFLGVGQPTRLSAAALETLAIVAYRQPITRAGIEAIRGVSADRALHALLARALVCEVGRLETVGRPIQFGTTPEFLQHFGLSGLDELPPFARFAELAEREPAAAPQPEVVDPSAACAGSWEHGPNPPPPAALAPPFP